MLAEQCRQWQPDFAVLADSLHAQSLSKRLQEYHLSTKVLTGTEGLTAVCELAEVSQVMAGIVGAAGLLPTLAAARAGKRVLLANKEALVMSGKLFMDAVHAHGAELLPIDSEHNAVFQCLPVTDGAGAIPGIERILLTASGGPFRTFTPEQLSQVTAEQACSHPNWVMGRKISVDSATMMNKGLEIIEACWLFGVRCDQVEVVVHPQSVVHSMVAYRDGSVLAQMGNPDMRTPIAHAMAWPRRMDAGVAPLDLCQVGRLEFEPPDLERFPALRLAREAFMQGGMATTVLNAANEVAVAAFLEGRLRFTAITEVVAECLEHDFSAAGASLEAILDMDQQARRMASELIAKMN
jgi:1-deoxy-D-xylulose-5-phosphate reductoisomerase